MRIMEVFAVGGANSPCPVITTTPLLQQGKGRQCVAHRRDHRHAPRVLHAGQARRSTCCWGLMMVVVVVVMMAIGWGRNGIGTTLAWTATTITTTTTTISTTITPASSPLRNSFLRLRGHFDRPVIAVLWLTPTRRTNTRIYAAKKPITSTSTSNSNGASSKSSTSTTKAPPFFFSKPLVPTSKQQPSKASASRSSRSPPPAAAAVATATKAKAKPSSLVGNDNNNNSNTGGLSRRQVAELTVAAVGLSITAIGISEPNPTDYGLWGVLPVGTYKSKKTILECIVPNQIWTLDQKFGILNVQVPLRMTVLKLGGTGASDGGLLLYNPIAPTRECISLVQDLVKQHGPVKHMVVGSVALEHKVYAGPFARCFPTASVWLQPGQYSFPINLPESFLGFSLSRTRMIPSSIDKAPADWQTDLDLATLGPIISRDGAFGETVLLHKPTRTLVVTDTALQAADDVPTIYQSDPAPLLFHARDTITDIVTDTAETRKKGWRRIVLFGLYFNPSAITIKDLSTALQERRPDINHDFAGIYPWDWNTVDEAASWKALTGDLDRVTGLAKGPLVAPILQVLLLNRSPVEVLDFANRVAQWDFNRIIPAHLKNNLQFNGAQYRAAFGFLEERGVSAGYPKPLDTDLKLLRDAEINLIATGAIVPAPPKVGGTASRAEILAQTMYQCRNDVCAPRSLP